MLLLAAMEDLPAQIWPTTHLRNHQQSYYYKPPHQQRQQYQPRPQPVNYVPLQEQRQPARNDPRLNNDED